MLWDFKTNKYCLKFLVKSKLCRLHRLNRSSEAQTICNRFEIEYQGNMSNQDNNSAASAPEEQLSVGDAAVWEELKRATKSGPFTFWAAWLAIPEGDEEAAIAVIASQFQDCGELVHTLTAWQSERQTQAAIELSKSVECFSRIDALDAMEYFVFVSRLPDGYQFLCATYLAKAIRDDSAVVLACARLFADQASPNHEAIQSWATAATQEASIDMLHTLLELVGPNAEILMCAWLEKMRFDEPTIRTSVLGREDDLLRSLLAAAASPKWAQTAWTVIARIATFCPSAKHALERALDAQQSPAAHGLANAMTAGRFDVALDGDHFAAALNRLYLLALPEPGLMHKVDTLTLLRLSRQNTVDDALAVLIELGASEHGEPVRDLPRCFDYMRSKPILMGRLVTNWLVRSDVPLNVLREVLSSSSIGQAPQLDIGCMNKTGEPQRRNAARKILGLLHDDQALCKLASFFAESPSLQPQGAIIAEQMLTEIWREYPSGAEEFLQSRRGAVIEVHSASALYERLLAECVAWTQAVEQLPLANELSATPAQRQALRSVNQQHSRDIMRNASNKSIFAGVFKNVYAAQGRRVATRSANSEVPQVFDLTQHSQRVSLPSSELCDPLGGILRRNAILKGLE